MARKGNSAKRPVAGPSRTGARGASPLRRKRHEAFVQSYLIHFNGYRAARAARYSVRMAQKIWPVILQRRDVQARLTALRIPQLDCHEELREKIIQHLWILSKGKGHLVAQHPMTGAIGFDWTRATPEDLMALDISSITISERSGRRRTTLRFRVANRLGALGPLLDILTSTTPISKRPGLFSGPKRVFTKEEVDFPPRRARGLK